MSVRVSGRGRQKRPRPEKGGCWCEREGAAAQAGRKQILAQSLQREQPGDALSLTQ